ncbi:MAG: hypothetical protein ACRDAX_07230 [Propionibacteriaceae bacterium]
MDTQPRRGIPPLADDSEPIANETSGPRRGLIPDKDSAPSLPRRAALADDSISSAKTYPSQTETQTNSNSSDSVISIAPQKTRLLHRSRKTWILALVILLALFLAAAGLTSYLKSRTQSTKAIPANSLRLIEPTDLSSLSSNWNISQTLTPVPTDAPTGTCLKGGTTRLPLAVQSSLRTLNENDNSVLHRIDVYENAEIAATAFSARRNQAATCEEAAYIVSSTAIQGVGESAFTLDIEIQESKPYRHSLLITKVGRAVEIFDLGKSEAISSLGTLTTVSHSLLTQHCQDQQAACGSTPVTVTTVPPPPGGFSGFLNPADVPRITPGTGSWKGTTPSPQIAFTGTQCENYNFSDVGALRQFQRTLILSEDSHAQSTFGIDNIFFEFPDPAQASNFASRLTDNIVTCTRQSTATVTKVTSLMVSANSATLPGQTAYVTQRVGGSVLSFRTGVVQSDKYVVYVVATPQETYDFNDTQWENIVIRAGQRLSQYS